MPKKTTKPAKNVEQLTQAHAKVETSQLTSLDQVWGYNESARYGTIDEGEYGLRLQNMTRADLENHARATGVLVVENSQRLRDSLMRQFRAYVASLKKPSPVAFGSKPKVSSEVQKILAEGK